MSLLAVTVVGSDRPGIVADVTAALASLRGNVEDSSMTLLRGHFAMTLILAVDAPASAVEQALAPITADGSLVVRVDSVTDDEAPAQRGEQYVMTVRGADHPGIVAAMTRVLADVGGNITDLSTRLSSSGLYVLTTEVTVPDTAQVDVLQQELAATAERVGVRVTLSPVDTDVL